MCEEPDELDRACPLCGKVEPVSVDVIEDALRRGLPDVWVCWECLLEKEVELSESALQEHADG